MLCEEVFLVSFFLWHPYHSDEKFNYFLKLWIVSYWKSEEVFHYEEVMYLKYIEIELILKSEISWGQVDIFVAFLLIRREEVGAEMCGLYPRQTGIFEKSSIG